MVMRRLLVLLAILGLAGGACSDDDGGRTAVSTSTAAPTTVATALDLPDQYACGYGVALGSTDQTVGLFVHVDYENFEIDRPPTEGGAIGGDTWVGELEQGTDLFANWCTDLITDPQAQVDDTIPVTSGTIELVDVPSDGGCGESATIELRDVELADGQTVPDTTVDADGWGCFPG